MWPSSFFNNKNYDFRMIDKESSVREREREKNDEVLFCEH